MWHFKKTTLIKILTILTFSFLLFSCSTEQGDKDEVYYVVKHPKASVQQTGDSLPPPPPPPTTYYGNFNFILLDSSTIYFHSQHIYRTCGTGIDETKPPKVFLVPDSLAKLNIADLPQFLASSINDSVAADRHFFASISSPTDTIRNKAFKIITDFLKSKKVMRYNIRNWTEEEQFVTTAKIENRKYDPNSIDWKIGFDTMFTPPTDSISIWIYDYLTDMPLKNREVKADTLTVRKLILFINTHKGGEKIHLDYLKSSNDTIFVTIKESTYLTQQMGTTGADDYMSTTTFTLTELRGIKYVNFAFEEGDHAVPGTYSRKYYIDRNKRNDTK